VKTLRINNIDPIPVADGELDWRPVRRTHAARQGRPDEALDSFVQRWTRSRSSATTTPTRTSTRSAILGFPSNPLLLA